MADPGERRLVESVQFEVIPLKGVEEKVLSLPEGSLVTVTASPAKGQQATIDLALEFQAKGYVAVPHLSARLMGTRAALESAVERLVDAGIDRVFVVGGDADQSGDYVEALDLLRDLADIGPPFVEVGITGYPEGHPSISDQRLREALQEKQSYATYIATQMCFDPKAIVNWLKTVRSDGVTLPVKVGVPGAVEPARLISVGSRIGVGDSMRYLAKNRRSLLKLLRPGSYSLDGLIEDVERLGSGLGLGGLHIFTFNQVAETAEWHQTALGA